MSETLDKQTKERAAYQPANTSIHEPWIPQATKERFCQEIVLSLSTIHAVWMIHFQMKGDPHWRWFRGLIWKPANEREQGRESHSQSWLGSLFQLPYLIIMAWLSLSILGWLSQSDSTGERNVKAFILVRTRPQIVTICGWPSWWEKRERCVIDGSVSFRVRAVEWVWPCLLLLDSIGFHGQWSWWLEWWCWWCHDSSWWWILLTTP